MEDLGTLESFFPTKCVSPFISNATVLQTFYNSSFSDKTTPIAKQKPLKKITMAQRYGLKTREST